MLASIDIGTNTVLLLVAEYDGHNLEVIREEQRVPRLGHGVDRSRNLGEEAMVRVINALQEYRQILAVEYPEVEQCTVTATSAVRDAGNRKQFRTLIKDQTGFDVRILSGEEEAEWTYLGALSLLEQGMKSSLVIDIGGGSTELALGEGPQLVDFHSYDIGSVRFTERFLHSDPATDREIMRCREAIREAFKHRPFSRPGETAAVGVAGTVTSLAFMQAGLSRYKATDLNGYILSTKKVNEWSVKLGKMKSGDILRTYPEVMEGRSDIILAGVLILDEFLRFHGLEELTVSTGGIRHGAVIKTLNKKGNTDNC